MRVGGEPHAMAAFPRGKRPTTRCTGGWGGLQGRFGWVQKISLRPGFDARTVLPVAIRCAGYAIPAHADVKVVF
jgi:hypothetical protein